MATHFFSNYLIDFGPRKFPIQSFLEKRIHISHYRNNSVSLSLSFAHSLAHSFYSLLLSQNINSLIELIHHSIYSLAIPVPLSHIMISLHLQLSFSLSLTHTYIHTCTCTLSHKHILTQALTLFQHKNIKYKSSPSLSFSLTYVLFQSFLCVRMLVMCLCKSVRVDTCVCIGLPV